MTTTAQNREYNERWYAKLSAERKEALAVKRRLRARARARERRVRLLMFLGGKCEICGFNDMRALQIDHINGGGNKEQLALGCWHMAEKVYNNPSKYQILCANHNWIKRADKDETGIIFNPRGSRQ